MSKLIRAAAEAGAQIILPSELFERQYSCLLYTSIMLEYGSRDGNLPPRPLWAPAFKAAGGKAALQKGP